MSIDDCCEISRPYVVDMENYKIVLYQVSGMNTDQHMLVENIYVRSNNGLELIEHSEYAGNRETVDKAYETLKQYHDEIFEKEFYYGNVVS